MGAAFGWGLFAASSLLIGGLLVLRVHVGDRLLGLIMAFGAGVLISAVAYELVEEAFSTSNGGGVAGGLAAGALVFFAGDAIIDRMGGEGRKSIAGGHEAGTALAIVLGIVLDGIPESAVIGLTSSRAGPSAWPCSWPCSSPTSRRRSPPRPAFASRAGGRATSSASGSS
jgi:zinc transporter, ZIP family